MDCELVEAVCWFQSRCRSLDSLQPSWTESSESGSRGHNESRFPVQSREARGRKRGRENDDLVVTKGRADIFMIV